MDTFFDSNKQVETLLEQYNTWGKIRVAFDFDDTVSPFRGNNQEQVVQLIKELRPYADLVCFTARSGERLMEVYNFLDNHNIPYDYINKEFDGTEITGKKINFNMLLDDKAGLRQAYEILQEFLRQIKNCNQ